MIKVLSSINVFLETLPIIGVSLVGIFGVTAFIILTVHLLNKGASWIEERKNGKDSQ